MSQNYFKKKFKFIGGSHLPPESAFFSTSTVQKHESLQIIKSILNHVKSKLNDFQIEEWSRHTRIRNPAQQIIHFLKNEIKGEFVTQAFAKFFECVSSYHLVNDNVKEKFQSVHLCEAPGAFICSLNHYMKLHHPEVEFNWRASTLNPYFEGNSISNTILDDRLISHTLENWIFGEEQDGDILKESNLRSLIDYCKNTLGEVNLVTGDGSIDCLDQPENQEEFVSNLHTAEFIVSLAILADGGSVLLKMFTFFETSSIALLYVLNCCFEELHVFKPATSKEGNSEVYVIGIGYKKSVMTNDVMEKIIKNFKSDKQFLQLDAIPQEFQQQVVEAARFFMNHQVGVIEGNIRTFRRYDKYENDRIKSLKWELVEEYVRLYKIAPIKEDQKILHGLQVNNDINLNVRVHSGSHSERMIFFHLSRSDQFQIFFDKLKQFYDSIFENALNSSCTSLKLSNTELDPSDFIKLIQGRSISKVVSSKFIVVTLVKFLIELRTFLDDSTEVYSGKKMTIVGNHLTIDMEFFRKAESYDAYEKEVATSLMNFFHSGDFEVFIVEGLPLFTQFMVGFVLYLSLFVFKEVHLKRSSGTISFKEMLPNGKENIKILMDILRNPSGILGITSTKLLFNYSQEYYKSVIDYNSHLCLKFCSFYLNISNNL